jgi:thiol-disulfide isomerase/thioredoxin
MTSRIAAFILAASLCSVVAAASSKELAAFGEGDLARRKSLTPLEGRPAPALAVTTWVNGKPATLADFKGKIVVLDFWATWCAPCIASIPHNNALAKKYADQGVVFIGVCHPKDGEKMTATAQDNGLGYASALDARGDTNKAYKVDSYPDYYVIDRRGVLRVADCANDKVEQVITALLKEK